MMYYKAYSRYWSRPSVRFCPVICLVGLRKKSCWRYQSGDPDLNLTTSVIRSRLHPLELEVTFYYCYDYLIVVVAVVVVWAWGSVVVKVLRY